MEQKGRKILASGNVLIWTLRDSGRRGAAHGHFSSDPSESDETEAMQFIESLRPSGSRTVVPTRVLSCGREAFLNRVDNFIDGGSRN